MCEKQVVPTIFFGLLLLGTGLVAGQAGSGATGGIPAAAEKLEAGDYPAAIELYQRAVNSAPNQRRKQEIQEQLNDAIRQYYTALYEQASAAGPRDERMELLVRAKSLGIRDWLFTDFEKVVLATRRLSEEIFNELKAEAETALEGNRYLDAIALYEQAREFDSYLFESQNLVELYNEIKEKASTGERLMSEGHQLIANGRYQEAEERFQQANAAFPGQQAVQAGLRRAGSMVILEEGKRQAQSREYKEAEEAFRRALERDQENGEAARLLQDSQNYGNYVRTAQQLYLPHSCEESKRELEQARQLNARRFRQDQLASLLSGDCSDLIPLPGSEIRQVLLALYDSRPGDAIQTLEVLLEEFGANHPHLRAFMGVSFCYVAFANAETDASALEDARQQFRQVLASLPDYRLSENLFSPRIREVFEELRSESRTEPASE